MFCENHWCDVFDYLRFNFKTQDFVMRLPVKATGMKNLEKVVCVHIKCAKVRALFAENKVRFARAEQLWCNVIKHTDRCSASLLSSLSRRHIDTVVKRGICYDRSVRRSVSQLHPWATPERSIYRNMFCTAFQRQILQSSIQGFTPNKCVKERHFSVDSENLTTAYLETVWDRM